MKKGGIFYTNNKVPKEILTASLQSIERASSKHGVRIISSSWEHIPIFENRISRFKEMTHFNLYHQILDLLFILNKDNIETVSFLEHDTLYGEDYFDYPEFHPDVLINRNLVGYCKDGYQQTHTKPLHQMTMKIDYAISYFSESLINSIKEEVFRVEPYTKYAQWNSPQNSVHINWGGNFTSHYKMYGEVTHKRDEYWGENLFSKDLFRS
jgi:hypothetical protein